MKKLTKKDFDKSKTAKPLNAPYIKIGMSTCGIAAGAQEVYTTLIKEAEQRELTISISQCGCIGMCHAEPLVEVAAEGLPTVVYGGVTKEIALRILEEHVCDRRLVNDHIYDLPVRR